MADLSKGEALKEARRLVSLPIRRSSTDYIVCGPWKDAKPYGARTEHQADSYPKALGVRTRWVARVALALMGKLTEDADTDIELAHYHGHETTIEGLVKVGLAA